MKKSRTRRAYMFGHRKDDIDTVGFLKVLEHGYEIVAAQPDATGFLVRKPRGAKDWGSPEQWLGFFRYEPELEDWKFHIVYYNSED